jgi:hypothetical protein
MTQLGRVSHVERIRRRMLVTRLANQSDALRQARHHLRAITNWMLISGASTAPRSSSGYDCPVSPPGAH